MNAGSFQPAAASEALTFATVNPKAAELLHALYAEAAHAAPVPPAEIPDGAVLLVPLAADRESVFSARWTHRSITMTAGDETQLHLQTPFIPSKHEVAGRWYGYENRLDAEGRRWERRVLAVVDNFGDLVEVSE